MCVLCVCVQVQPVAELVELSRRWAADGRQIRLNDVIAKGGTLRRTGSLRHRATKVLPFFFPPLFVSRADHHFNCLYDYCRVDLSHPIEAVV